MTDPGSDEGEILLGLWDCTSCGTRGVRGDSYECSGCGAARPDDVEFYLPDDAEVVRDAEGIAAAEAGPDWQCAYCDAWTPATDTSCSRCGGSREDSERRQETGEVDDGSVPKARLVSHDPAPSQPHPRGPRTGSGILSKLGLVGVGALALCCLSGVIYSKVLGDRRAEHDARIAAQQQVVDRINQSFGPEKAKVEALQARLADARRAVVEASERLRGTRASAAGISERLTAHRSPRPVVVAKHAWQVSVDLERCEAEAGEGWSQPAGAFDSTSEQRVKGHQRVLDHVETRYRSETYREQDGYDTESYTERVADGTKRVQDGTTTKNLGNGRFKRVPKYRTETVYKTVTKTRRVPRYVTKTRQVPYKEEVYRQDPVYGTWYRYKTWRWVSTDGLSRAGEGQEVLDPEGTPPRDVAPAQDTRRITGRAVTLSLELRPDGGGTNQSLTLDPGRWSAFADGDPALRVGDTLYTKAEHASVLERLERDLAATEASAEAQQGDLDLLEARVGPVEAELTTQREATAPLKREYLEAIQVLEELRRTRP